MMKLYLVRHAEAVPVGGKVLRDADRPLSEAGVKEAVHAGRALARLAPVLDAVLVSPLARARETGERLAAERRAAVPVRASELLEPGFKPEALLAELFSGWQDRAVALIGHQPDIGQFLSYLISGDFTTDVAFRPGTVACVGVSGTPENFGGRLEWLLSPEALRSLQGPDTQGAVAS